MISKNELKYIQSFAHKKHWAEESVFIVEGPKLVGELLESDWEVEAIYGIKEWEESANGHLPNFQLVTEEELERMSLLQQPNQVIALVKKKQYNTALQFKGKSTIVLDGIQDPGNLGTILRMADWFGISHVICSKDTVDCYNSKVLQATMGAIFRVSVSYVDLVDFFTQNTKPVYGALLEGDNLFNTTFEKEGIILLGNEGNGIRETTKNFIKYPITIPKYGNAESLNVATAGAIILGSLFRGI